MGDSVHHAASAQQRHRLFPALSLKTSGNLEQASLVATGGGSLVVSVTNNGLAAAFRPYLEAVRFTFSIGAPNGLMVWDLRPDGVGYWRRPRAGERFAPDRRLVEPIPVPVSPGSTARERWHMEGPGSFPESFMTGAPEASRLARVAANVLQPTQTVDVSLVLPPIPPEAGDGILRGWCIGLRCFDVLTDPAPAAQLPVPAQPPHNTQVICLHTAT